jgi:flagellar biosynthesis/type III secretory pathway M-ring protein FliF/YscJ
VLAGRDVLYSDAATPATSSAIASTSHQNKPNQEEKEEEEGDSLNVCVCYNNFMPLGGKISLISVSLWEIHHFAHYVCAAVFWAVLAVALFFVVRKLYMFLKALNAL